MAILKIESDVAGAIGDYKFAREMMWHPGGCNVDRVEADLLPVMHVSRRLIMFGFLPIPILPKRMEVPPDVFATHPIPKLRHRHADHH